MSRDAACSGDDDKTRLDSLAVPTPDSKTIAAPEPRRHQATERIWQWLEDGPGLIRLKEEQAAIREQLLALDRELFRIDGAHYARR